VPHEIACYLKRATASVSSQTADGAVDGCSGTDRRSSELFRSRTVRRDYVKRELDQQIVIPSLKSAKPRKGASGRGFGALIFFAGPGIKLAFVQSGPCKPHSENGGGSG
jgi:hypothetical protein